MDLSSRLRAIVRGVGPGAGSAGSPVNRADGHPGPPGTLDDGQCVPGHRSEARPGGEVTPAGGGLRELTYVPDSGAYEGTLDLARVGATLGGLVTETPFGPCLVIDRRYEADRFHGSIRIGDCDMEDCGALGILDPSLRHLGGQERDEPRDDAGGLSRMFPRTVFIDLETTGLSGGAGTLAFLVGCGFFDLGAFQVRQFLLTSHAGERALLAAVADFFHGADLIVTYNGKTFDVPVMETRWMFHRQRLPLEAVPHFDMLHPARRLWRSRAGSGGEIEEGGCRLSTLEHTLFGVHRIGDVPGFEIPGRFFNFLRTGDPRPLEPVLEHNRLDLVSLAAVMARGLQLARAGHPHCRDGAEALALGRVYERAGELDRAEACYEAAAAGTVLEVRGEALYRLGLRHRRERRFAEAAERWRGIVALTEPRGIRRLPKLRELREFAVEALAIHHEHRERDLDGARELALFALQEAAGSRAQGIRHRLARIDRKISERLERRGATRGAREPQAGKKRDAQLFSS